VFLPGRSSLQGWKEYISISLPATVFICSEWWFFEVMTVFAAMMSETDLKVMSLVLNFGFLVYCMACGAMRIALTTMIGNATGAENVNLVKKIINLSFYVVTVPIIFFMIIPIVFSEQIAHLLTSDENMIEPLSKAFVIFGIFYSTEGLTTYLQGHVRGLGKQTIGSYAQIFSYYLIGIPLALMLGFKMKMDVYGLQYAMGIASGVAAFL
jgi:MATE family multidrug resistance protein